MARNLHEFFYTQLLEWAPIWKWNDRNFCFIKEYYNSDYSWYCYLVQLRPVSLCICCLMMSAQVMDLPKSENDILVESGYCVEWFWNTLPKIIARKPYKQFPHRQLWNQQIKSGHIFALHFWEKVYCFFVTYLLHEIDTISYYLK